MNKIHDIEEIKRNLPFLEFHTVNKMPIMDREKLEGLKMDIFKNSKIVNPIWIVDGKILDGRSRYIVLRQLKQDNLLNFVPDIRIA